MASWPATLPCPDLIDAQISADDSVLRSNMDAGPPSRRNRFTAITKSVSYTMTLRGDQVAVLDTFYHSTLRNGSLSFDWVDPRTGAAVLIAFKGPPQYTSRSKNKSQAQRLWLASLSLEIQP